MAVVRLGLAGVGRWGQAYVRTIGTLDDARLARTSGRDWRELIDPRQIDALIIATPPATHAEIALAAVRSGIPVLIEKPLALSAADARAVRDAAKAAGVTAWIGHTHLFSPAFRALKGLVARYGGVREIRGEAGNHGPYRTDVSVLWDWGPHDVAMCLDLMGCVPASAACTVLERESERETVSIALSFPSGVPASIVVSNAREKVRRFSVRCREATLVYDDLSPHKLTVDGTPVAVGAELPLTVAVREFVAALGGAEPDYASLELGVAVVETLEACR